MKKLTSREIRSLVNVALGKEKADLVIVNGDLVNVYTREILPGYSVAIKGERIAYVGENAGHTIGPKTEVIDASGKFLIPGLIDGHTHLLDRGYRLEEFLRFAIPGGTTTIITETMEIAFPLGYQGVVDFLESTKGQPIKIFITVPPMVSLSSLVEGSAIDPLTLRKLLKRNEVVGLGETYWADLLRGGKRLFELLAETLASGKKAEGHSAGARSNKLVAYLASGISSCHEPITVDEILERLRLGLHVMIREGDVRGELEAVSEIKDKDIDFRRLILVTDGVSPERLVKDGHMEFVVQKAINLGFDPITAIQMATLNVAEHFSLDNLIGGIAPGKYADIVIIPDLKTIKAEYVISNGQIIAQEGKVLIPPRSSPLPRKVARSVQIRRKFEPADFIIPAEDKGDFAKVRVIDLVTNLVTREALLELPVSEGQIKADIERDILKVAVITGDGQTERLFTGLVKGFGIKKGALATTAVWDNCAIAVVGASEEEMAQAVNRIITLQGGIVLAVDAQIQAELPLPIAGLISDQPMENIVRKLKEIQLKLTELGCSLPDAYRTLTTLTSPAIPFLRLSEEGLVDLQKGERVPLFVT